MINYQNYKHRNPLIVTPMGNFLQGIGDTHLGRVFKNDVPLSRRGDYEKTQKQKLTELLNKEVPEGCDKSNFMLFQAGDWFDKPVVDFSTIYNSKVLLEKYAHKNSAEGVNIPLAILSGNHDDSKNLSDVTAWDLLAEMLRTSIHNYALIKMVKEYYVKQFGNGEQILFIGWNITQSACEALIKAKDEGYNNITTVVCHLDKISYGNEDNVIPYEFFAAQGIKMVISGHEHKPYHFFEQGMEIIGTGSLLPYSHAEDDGEEIYVTLNSINEYLAYFEENDVADKHIRLILDEADQERASELTQIHSLSFKIVKKGVDISVLDMDAIDAVEQVNTEAYDPKAVWRETVIETNLDSDTASLVWSEIEAKGVEE